MYFTSTSHQFIPVPIGDTLPPRQVSGLHHSAHQEAFLLTFVCLSASALDRVTKTLPPRSPHSKRLVCRLNLEMEQLGETPGERLQLPGASCSTLCQISFPCRTRVFPPSSTGFFKLL